MKEKRKKRKEGKRETERKRNERKERKIKDYVSNTNSPFTLLLKTLYQNCTNDS